MAKINLISKAKVLWGTLRGITVVSHSMPALGESRPLTSCLIGLGLTTRLGHRPFCKQRK